MKIETALVFTRQTHGALPRPAKKRTIAVARKVGPKGKFKTEPTVTGQTRKWQFDLRLSPTPFFVHHILVLPNLEETFSETAGLARI